MKATKLLRNLDDNGFEFRSRTQSSTHHLLLQGPSSKRSSPSVVPFLEANSQLLLIPKLDTHVDIGYVSNVFHKSILNI
jgi:hypothetical protein